MRWIKQGCILMCLLLVIGCTGCANEYVVQDNQTYIYFFDSSKNALVSEVLPDDFATLETNQQKVDYIITRLQENKSTLLTPLQIGLEMPINRETTSINTKGNMVKIDFTSEYNQLTPQQKIGMRAALVYSLTELDFIDSVDFYVEQVPLTTATGKIVGAIRRSDITSTLTPSTKVYVINVYFANKEGKLVKEVHSFTGSDSIKEEKLVIDELIRGPNTEDLVATVPSDMKVVNVETLNGVCQVNLSFDLKSKFFKDEEKKTLMIYSIVNSLTELPQIKKVIISIDGKDEVAFTSTIDLPNTFERSEAYISQD